MNAALKESSPFDSVGSARAGLTAIRVWIAIEFGIRTLLGPSILLLFWAVGFLPRTPEPLGQIFTIALAVSGLALLTLATVFYRRAVNEGLTWQDLGYHSSRMAVLVGVVSGAMLLALVNWGTIPLGRFLFPSDNDAKLLRMLGEAGTLAAGLLLLSNGIAAPLVEEFAWRGYIQTRLTEGWGVGRGLLATALLFAGKHMLVEVSFNRTATLLVVSLALCVVRQRWGTTASTITHLVVNFVATLSAIIDAL